MSVTKDEYIKMYQRGILGSDFVILRNYLKYVPDIYTKEQADAILNSSMADKDLEASVKYYISAIPVTVFVDKDGNIVTKRIGGMNEQMLSGYIENLIGE